MLRCSFYYNASVLPKLSQKAIYDCDIDSFIETVKQMDDSDSDFSFLLEDHRPIELKFDKDALIGQFETLS